MGRGIRGATLRIAVTALCGITVGLGACKRENSGAAGGADTAMTAMPSADTMAPGGAASKNTAGGMSATNTMTDPQIFARLTAANEGEIAAGKMAESKATNADVKAFARQMVTDHTKMLKEGTALAKRLNITPDTAASDSIQSANKAMADALTAAPKGVTFDTTYVTGQVTGHQATLDMIKDAANQAQNADLKKALNDAIPTVQHHLDRIKDIQSKMK